MKLPRLVAICGKRRSGKDTIADMLCTEYGYQKIRIADPLKKVVKILFGYEDDQLECDFKDVLDPRWGVSPRQVMQYMGTEVMQEHIQQLLPDIGRKFWIRSLIHTHLEKAADNPSMRLVIPDLRFLHEEEELRKYGVTIWKVHRRDVEAHACDLHVSEKEWQSIHHDVLIENHGNVDALKQVVQKSIGTWMPTSLHNS